jgi:hypothetical protein
VKQVQSPASCDQGQSCVHHWMIDQTNHGVCKKCGSAQQFRNWAQAATSWYGYNKKAKESSGGVAHVER